MKTTKGRARPSAIFFRGGPVEKALRERGESAGLVAKRDLERYYEVLAGELLTVQFTPFEASRIVEACHPGRVSCGYQLLWAHIENWISLKGLDIQLGSYRGPLPERIRSLTAGQTMAVIDAAERFWVVSGSQTTGDTDESLRAVGLLHD